VRKVVFITGSSKGLGFEIALEFSKIGYCVVLNGRDEAVLKQKLTLLDDNGHFVFKQDFLLEDAIENTEKFFDKIGLAPDIIVHSLGGKLDGDFHPIKPQTLHATMRLNLESAIGINNIFIPHMSQNKGGYIAHIGSLAGINANASPCYAISKAALHAYIKNSARYYAKQGIAIFGVVPGILGHTGSDWDRKKELEPQKYTNRLSQTLSGSFINPNEIAKYIVSLSVVPSKIISGSILEFLNE